MNLSPHDGTMRFDECPFYAVRTARVKHRCPVNTLRPGDTVTVVREGDLHVHHLSNGWYVWVRDDRRTWLVQAEQLEAP